ncbi:hypothetical protein [Streptococcus lactarius]
MLYAIQYYINNKITPVGDQTAFLKYAEEYHYNYLFLELTVTLHGVADY